MHEYLGFTPSFSHAVLRGVPSGMSTFFPFDVRTVMRSGQDDDDLPPRPPDVDVRTTMENARAVDPRRRAAVSSRRAVDINENLDIFAFLLIVFITYVNASIVRPDG